VSLRSLHSPVYGALPAMARPRWADMADSSVEDMSQTTSGALPARARPRWADMADSSVEDMSQMMSPPIYQDSYEAREGASQELLGERLEGAELEEPDATLEDAAADSTLVETETAAPARPRPTSSLSRGRHIRESDLGEAMEADGAERQSEEAASGLDSRKRPPAAASGPALKRQRTPNSLEETPDESDPTAASSSAAPSSSRPPPSPSPEPPSPSPEAPAQADDGNVDRAVQKRRAVVSAHKRRPDYLAFSAARPRHVRDPDEPMTPDTEESMPKRQWETRIQRWREGLRDWFAIHGDGNGHDQDPETV